MNPNLTRSLDVDLKAQLAASRPRKGKGDARPSTSVITVVPTREDLSYFSPPQHNARGHTSQYAYSH